MRRPKQGVARSLIFIALLIVTLAVQSSFSVVSAGSIVGPNRAFSSPVTISKEAQARVAEVEELAKSGDSKAVKEVFEAIVKEVNYFAALKMGRALRHFKDEKALKQVFKCVEGLKGEDDAFDMLYAFRGLAAAKAEVTDKYLDEKLIHKKTRDVFVKLAIVEAYVSEHRFEKLDSLALLLKDFAAKEKVKDLEAVVMISIMKGLARLTEEKTKPRTILALAKVLETCETDQVRFHAASIASNITGEPANYDYRFWWQWAMDKDKEAKKEEGKGEKPPRRATREQLPKPTFFGMEAIGTRVVFVIDRSGSMAQEVELPDEMKKPPEDPEKHRTGGNKKKKKDDEAPSRPDYSDVETKLDLAKVELIFTLKYLPEHYEFNVVVYSKTHRELLAKDSNSSKGMYKATKANKEAFITAIEKLTAGSSTNIHGALRHAFRVTNKDALDKEDDPAVDERVFEHGAETIFFLTDGFPTHSDIELGVASQRVKDNAPDYSGSIDPYGPGQGTMIIKASEVKRCRDNILLDMTRMNSFRHVVIHCVGIGKHDDGLMKGLSKMSSGSYKDFSGLDKED